MHKLAVKLDGIERRKRSTGLLHIVAGLFLIVSAGMYYLETAEQKSPLMLLLYGVAIVSMLYGFFRRRIDPVAKYNHWVRLLQFIAFTVLAINLLNSVNIIRILSLALWAIVILFLMFTERKVFHDTDLQIKEEGIFVPGYFRNDLIPWSGIEGFVLRSDFLTITRADKKYVQLELLKDVDPAEIDEINFYCAKRTLNSGEG
jgi:hypothetical protein